MRTGPLLIILIGLAVALPALAEITNPARGIFVDFGGTCPPDATPNTPCNSFGYLLTFFIRQILLFAGVLAVLFVIIGGFQYITAGVNQELAETGKKTLTNAIIGLVIIILSYAIVTVINNALG